MNVAIIGSRSFTNYNFAKENIIKIFKEMNIQKKDITSIVSGGAFGADTLGEKFADEYSIYKKIYYAKWDKLDTENALIKINSRGNKYNARAGFDRNKEIVNNSDLIIAFWDMKSKGTKDSLDYAKKTGKQVKIVDISKIVWEIL